ncbi:MAPEG family protein [Afifella aestuarii]|uniref:MAPEG family protein n=1 Tax=Afifella aestuarii TaxID=1909496 RepID=UPI000FE41650|nr:MAPEG family protein [Afifella aestuarii]
MEAAATGLPVEMTLLGWSVILLIVHIIVQSGAATRETGLDYNASPRDEGNKAWGVMAGRSSRALKNFLETYPAFVAMALALAVTDKTGGLGAIGAHVWFWARIVYLPLYLLGIPYIRSIVWTISVGGILLMLWALFF